MKDKLIEFVSIQLDKDLKEPLYVQLYEQIKLMIKQHLLSPGYKLPSVRNLAQNLQVNPSTVVNAYKELEKNGLGEKILIDYLKSSRLFSEDKFGIIEKGVSRYFAKDYISSLHILTPQFESAFLFLSEKTLCIFPVESYY